jgi:gas vesicle protein
MFIRSRLGRLIMWMGLAAAATYFLDPELGERRRRKLRMRIQQMRDTAEQTRLETTGL